MRTSPRQMVPAFPATASRLSLALAILALLAVLLPGGRVAAQSSDLDALDEATRGLGPQTCYTRDEAFALETHRVYSELLVASLACEAQYGLADGYATYVDFSNRQEALLVETQTDLERLLGGAAAFNAHVTRLANEQSLLIDDFGTSRFCNIYRYRYQSVISASPDSLRAYLQDLAGRVLASQRGC